MLLFEIIINCCSIDPENWMVYKVSISSLISVAFDSQYAHLIHFILGLLMQVWWGNKPSMAKGDLSGIPGYKSFNSLHPVRRDCRLRCCIAYKLFSPLLTIAMISRQFGLQRKIFISKLPKIRTDPEVDLRRAELERAFRKYGGDRGVTVVVPKHSTFAFVEMETERQADLALQEMATQYRVNRARRTRHEALQEERAAAEAAKMGKTKENADWD